MAKIPSQIGLQKEKWWNSWNFGPTKRKLNNQSWKTFKDLPWILRKANDKFAGSTITTKTKKPLKTLTSRTRTTWFFWKNFRWWCLQFRISAMKSKQNWVHAKMCFSVDLTEKNAVSRKIAIIADLDKIIVFLHYWQLLTN